MASQKAAGQAGQLAGQQAGRPACRQASKQDCRQENSQGSRLAGSQQAHNAPSLLSVLRILFLSRAGKASSRMRVTMPSNRLKPSHQLARLAKRAILL